MITYVPVGPRVYVAGPYRGDVRANVARAQLAALEIAREGACPFIPHSMYFGMDGNLSDAWFLSATLDLLRACQAVYLLPGWEQSQGTLGEIAEANRIGMPILSDMRGLRAWIDSNRWLP